MRSGRGGGRGGATQRGRGGRGTPMVRAPPMITPPPMTEATMATRIKQLEQRLAPWQVSSIDHIQEARLPHLMGEMIFFIWLV